MNPPDRPFSQLITTTCACTQGSLERRRNLDQLIRQLQLSGKLWHRPFDIPETDYDEILQTTWIYVCGNLCEATTATKPYDSQRANVTTWINAYIRMRILDYYLRKPLTDLGWGGRNDGEPFDLIAQIPAPPEPSPILQEMLTWLARESLTLQRVHLRDRPDVNCKILIQRRIPPQETPWHQLADEFGVCISTLQGFYRRQCLPRLREAGTQFGFL